MRVKLLAMIFLFYSSVRAEGYFELLFKDSHTSYYGLLLYYDDDNPLNKMRIHYNNENGERILIEQKIRIEYNDSLGTNYRVMQGYDVKIIDARYPSEIHYFPDKFIFKKKDTAYYEPDYTTSNVDQMGVVKGSFKYFRLIQSMTKKKLREFGWKSPYGKTHAFSPHGEIDFSFNSRRLLPTFQATSGTQIFYDPAPTSFETGMDRDYSNDTTHLIIISNTNDEELGPTCQKNESGIDRYFSSIVMKAGGKLNKVLIKGQDFNVTNLETAINNLNPASNSGIIFYYSGHGFRPDDSKDSLPVLDLRLNPLVDVHNATNTKKLREIYDSLKSKKPRFCLTIAECCNNEVGVQSQQLLPNNPRQSLKTAASAPTIREILAKKLMDFDGSLLIATASPNQLTYYYPEDGGVFGKYLRDRMHSILLYSENPEDANWIEFFKYSANETDRFLKTQDINYLQIPIWVY